MFAQIAGSWKLQTKKRGVTRVLESSMSHDVFKRIDNSNCNKETGKQLFEM